MKLLRRCEVVIAEFRGLDEQKRTAKFVAATERAVRVSSWGPPEVLRMKGARLARFRSNPVMLDNHRRESALDVIGSVDVKVQGKRLHADVTYDTDPTSEAIWQKVKSGSLRAVSIGYAVNPNRVRRLRDGEVDGEGDAAVQGPADIVNEWTLLELSQVPIGADEDALRRSFYAELEGRGGKEGGMRRNKNGRSIYARDEAPAEGEREIDEELGEIADDEDQVEGEADPAPQPRRQAARSAAPKVILTPAAREAQSRAAIAESHKREVFAITPKGLEHVAERAIAEGLSLADTRKRLLEEHAKRYEPVGTTEPTNVEGEDEAEGTTGQRAEKSMPAEVTDEILVRSFENLR